MLTCMSMFLKLSSISNWPPLKIALNGFEWISVLENGWGTRFLVDNCIIPKQYFVLFCFLVDLPLFLFVVYRIILKVQGNVTKQYICENSWLIFSDLTVSLKL